MKTKENNNQPKRPMHLAKVRHGQREYATYKHTGAAWFNEQYGSFYVKLYGKQIINDGFTKDWTI